MNELKFEIFKKWEELKIENFLKLKQLRSKHFLFKLKESKL